jgi:hypothetical protein
MSRCLRHAPALRLRRRERKQGVGLVGLEVLKDLGLHDGAEASLPVRPADILAGRLRSCAGSAVASRWLDFAAVVWIRTPNGDRRGEERPLWDSKSPLPVFLVRALNSFDDEYMPVICPTRQLFLATDKMPVGKRRSNFNADPERTTVASGRRDRIRAVSHRTATGRIDPDCAGRCQPARRSGLRRRP